VNVKRILEVAGEQAGLVEERTPAYRASLVRCLVEVVATQDEGLSDKGRRDRVAKIVEAFGSKVAADKGRTNEAG